MQLIFQVPIIDLRQALEPEETLNVWPSADMSKEQVDGLMKKSPFIRNFGRIQSSSSGYFCGINCIHADKLMSNGFPVNNKKVPIFNINKQLNSMGTYATAIEFGFMDQLESDLKYAQPQQQVELTEILSHYLALPLEVQDMARNVSTAVDTNNSSDWTTVRLADLGPIMARNYLYATAKNKKAEQNEGSVVNGEICLALFFAAGDNIKLPANAEKMDEFVIDGITTELFGYKINIKQQTTKIWLFKVPDMEALTSMSFVLELEKRLMNLFRLNVEKETMRILMNSFNAENIDDNLKKYIKNTPRKIYRKERFSAPQDGLRNFALQSENAIVQFSIEDLKEVLDSHVLANLKSIEANMKLQVKKTSVLFITSSPSDITPIDFGEHFKAIVEAWKKGTDREYFSEPKIKTGVEREDFMEAIYTEEPDLLHVTLHNNQNKGLYFQDKNKNIDPMSVEEFADYIKTINEEKQIDTVVLCACNSLGHAQVAKTYCNNAVGTNYVFPDEAAIVYANKFYTALFNGKTIQFCHSVAVQGIKHTKPPFILKEGPEVHTIIELL